MRGWPSLGRQYRVDLLLEGVGACSPPREEDREADGLEELGDDVQADGLEAALLGKGLGEELERKGWRALASTTSSSAREPREATRERGGPNDDRQEKLTPGALVARKIKLPRYAAPL